MKLVCGTVTREVRLEKNQAWLDGRRFELTLDQGRRGAFEIWLDGRRRRVAVGGDGARVLVFCEGRTFSFERASRRPARASEHAGELVAPMPGRVRRLLVAEGERVEIGQVVLVLEAMKMEHAIRAPNGGLIARLAYREGDLVEAGAELAVIE